jgi:hypothetical protein
MGAVALFVALLVSAGAVFAQSAPGGAFGIVDNSFFVEEAFNQDPGTFQNIMVVQPHGEGATDFTFTQEWPLGSLTHQFGYSVPVSRADGRAGLGDVVLSYRYQVWTERDGRPAFAPRVSLILPSGSVADGFGAGAAGWQMNLPFSRRRGPVYLHGNAGFTWVSGRDAFTPHAGASAVWNTRPMLNLMIEALAEFEEDAAGLTLSPGVRGGWNVGRGQVILGGALPVERSGGMSDASALVYVSYEGPFR